jgi:tRNA G18 (ribose-2'-O)-methylase SpoU
MLVVLDNLRSSYNVGSILRTCDALGIKEVYFCGITPGLADKKVQKTALGAEKNIKSTETNSTYDTVTKLRSDGYQIIGLELSDKAVDLGKIHPSAKCALIVGNEVSGISGEIMGLCDNVAQIPMKGIKESLNVSVAFGIAVYTLTRLTGSNFSDRE